MVVLVRQNSETVISISPVGYELDGEHGEGRCWMPGVDAVLVEGWANQIGSAGAWPAVYRLASPAMFLYDDPFCPGCGERDESCDCFERVGEA